MTNDLQFLKPEYMKDLDKAVDEAIYCRERLARTFASKVGIAFEMRDGFIIGGFNIETYAHKGYHAEEVGIIRALAQGYNGTDFVGMAEVFQAKQHQEFEIYPACPSCWFWLWEFTNPELEIAVADTEGKVRFICQLKDCIHPVFPAQVFPSDLLKGLKPKSNSASRISI